MHHTTHRRKKMTDKDTVKRAEAFLSQKDRIEKDICVLEEDAYPIYMDGYRVVQELLAENKKMRKQQSTQLRK